MAWTSEWTTDHWGIWRAPHKTAEGYPYLKAVSADNRVLIRATVYPWDDEKEVVRVLRRALSDIEPRPEGGHYA